MFLYVFHVFILLLLEEYLSKQHNISYIPDINMKNLISSSLFLAPYQ